MTAPAGALLCCAPERWNQREGGYHRTTKGETAVTAAGLSFDSSAEAVGTGSAKGIREYETGCRSGR